MVCFISNALRCAIAYSPVPLLLLGLLATGAGAQNQGFRAMYQLFPQQLPQNLRSSAPPERPVPPELLKLHILEPLMAQFGLHHREQAQSFGGVELSTFEDFGTDRGSTHEQTLGVLRYEPYFLAKSYRDDPAAFLQRLAEAGGADDQPRVDAVGRAPLPENRWVFVLSAQNFGNAPNIFDCYIGLIYSFDGHLLDVVTLALGRGGSTHENIIVAKWRNNRFQLLDTLALAFYHNGVASQRQMYDVWQRDISITPNGHFQVGPKMCSSFSGTFRNPGFGTLAFGDYLTEAEVFYTAPEATAETACTLLIADRANRKVKLRLPDGTEAEAIFRPDNSAVMIRRTGKPDLELRALPPRGA
jgi:hypothetical protein